MEKDMVRWHGLATMLGRFIGPDIPGRLIDRGKNVSSAPSSSSSRLPPPPLSLQSLKPSRSTLVSMASKAWTLCLVGSCVYQCSGKFRSPP